MCVSVYDVLCVVVYVCILIYMSAYVCRMQLSPAPEQPLERASLTETGPNKPLSPPLKSAGVTDMHIATQGFYVGAGSKLMSSWLASTLLTEPFSQP